MTMADHRIRCQRCGTEMEMKDPAPGAPWRPEQFWVCPKCHRHFWTSYATPAAPPAAKEQAKEAPKPAVEPTVS